MHTVTPTRIVILGGGYAAVRAYRRLVRKLRLNGSSDAVELTVLCPIDHHTYHGWTAEVLEGLIRSDHRLSPLQKIFTTGRLIKGVASRVDMDAKVVHVQDNDGNELPTLAYDHLVIATGSREHVERVPGMAQHGIGLKHQRDLERLGEHVREQLLRAGHSTSASEREAMLTFVVVGGGITGVEICAGLAELLHRERHAFPILATDQPRVMLVHSGAAILSGWGDHDGRLVQYATEELQRYGVTIRLSDRASEVTAAGIRFESGAFIPTATVISTIGQRLQPLPGTEQLHRDPSGRILTDGYLRATGYDHVWAGGDVASVQQHRTGQPCPANALWAMHHGDLIGENLSRVVRNKPLHCFTYPGLGTVASLGIGKGFGEVWGHEFTGWFPWIVRSLVFLFYMPSRVQAMRIVRDLLAIPFSMRTT
jgi:NADH dehydrogenase